MQCSRGIRQNRRWDIWGAFDNCWRRGVRERLIGTLAMLDWPCWRIFPPCGFVSRLHCTDATGLPVWFRQRRVAGCARWVPVGDTPYNFIPEDFDFRDACNGFPLHPSISFHARGSPLLTLRFCWSLSLDSTVRGADLLMFFLETCRLLCRTPRCICTGGWTNPCI